MIVLFREKMLRVEDGKILAIDDSGAPLTPEEESLILARVESAHKEIEEYKRGNKV